MGMLTGIFVEFLAEQTTS